MNPEVRELTAEDAQALGEFFLRMPPEDRTFFFQDVNDPAVAEAWASDDRRLRRCACGDDGRIIAFSALQPGVDWSSHVAELVLVVAPEARRQGLGRRLLEALEDKARELGYARIRLDTGNRQPHAQAMYERAGYHPIENYNGNSMASFWGEKILR